MGQFLSKSQYCLEYPALHIPVVSDGDGTVFNLNTIFTQFSVLPIVLFDTLMFYDPLGIIGI